MSNNVWIIAALWKQEVSGFGGPKALYALVPHLKVPHLNFPVFLLEKLCRRHQAYRKLLLRVLPWCGALLLLAVPVVFLCINPDSRWSQQLGSHLFQLLKGNKGKWKLVQVFWGEKWWNEMMHVPDERCRCCCSIAYKSCCQTHLRSWQQIAQIAQQYGKGCKHSDTNLLYGLA